MATFIAKFEPPGVGDDVQFELAKWTLIFCRADMSCVDGVETYVVEGNPEEGARKIADMMGWTLVAAIRGEHQVLTADFARGEEGGLQGLAT